jgi:hypothetical protein
VHGCELLVLLVLPARLAVPEVVAVGTQDSSQEWNNARLNAIIRSLLSPSQQLS